MGFLVLATLLSVRAADNRRQSCGRGPLPGRGRLPGSQRCVLELRAGADGALPEGAEVVSQPRFGGWAVRAEANAPSPPNALCQTGMAAFSSMALSTQVYTDLTLAARFERISGVVDQAAGLLLRIQDADN